MPPAMDDLQSERLVDALAALAIEAGRAVLAFDPARGARLKTDGSPVTEADEAAERVLLAGLRKLLPDVPIIAEESAAAGILPAQNGTFVLVDPLDGTREFVTGCDSYTVNIGIVAQGRPITGIVHAPAMGLVWSGGKAAARHDLSTGERKPIAVRQCDMARLRILASRSHRSAQTDAYLAHFPQAELVYEGSAVKFCRIAEGDADFYPRFEPTMEWDTAAGHALLRAAGGDLVNPDGSPFAYGKAEKKYNNGNFLAGSQTALAQMCGR